MNNIKAIEKIRKFLSQDFKYRSKFHSYSIRSNQIEYFNELAIKVDLNEHKEIILKEETELELGGEHKKSFSLIYPIQDLDMIENGKITLIGPEINEITDNEVDFGLFILVGFEQKSEDDFNKLREFNFVSNGIEGFMIRTIPRRFWCRISKNIIQDFSFEFFGNAIFYLYRNKFENLLKSMEILFIVSDPKLIEQFMNLTTEMRNHIDSIWREKVENWKQRIDCDYEWDCIECPYYEVCEDLKEVVAERDKIRD